MDSAKKASVFVTCLVDFFRPVVGFAAVRLLERAGFSVRVPRDQTCCGQPSYHSGDRANTRRLASRVIEAFRGSEPVVIPSGSCAAMIRNHYPALFTASDVLRREAEALSARTFELSSFLVENGADAAVSTVFDGKVAYHDSCAALRGLRVAEQPRALLRQVRGLEVLEISDPETCCGFGGAFCVAYGEVSTAMVKRKALAIQESGAGMLLGGDLGCLLNIAGRLSRDASGIEVRHAAELWSGMMDSAALAQSREIPSSGPGLRPGPKLR